MSHSFYYNLKQRISDNLGPLQCSTLSRYQTVRNPRVEKPQPREEVKLEPGEESSQEPVYVCEVREVIGGNNQLKLQL